MACNLEAASNLLAMASNLPAMASNLDRKDRMWENFQRMAQQHRELNFDFVPETFVLPQQLRSFKQRYLKTRPRGGLGLGQSWGSWR